MADLPEFDGGVVDDVVQALDEVPLAVQQVRQARFDLEQVVRVLLSQGGRQGHQALAEIIPGASFGRGGRAKYPGDGLDPGDVGGDL